MKLPVFSVKYPIATNISLGRSCYFVTSRRFEFGIVGLAENGILKAIIGVDEPFSIDRSLFFSYKKQHMIKNSFLYKNWPTVNTFYMYKVKSVFVCASKITVGNNSFLSFIDLAECSQERDIYCVKR